MSEKKKHKVIIGIEISLLCMILATLSINASSSNPPSNGVSYNKNNQVTVQNALDDLYNKANYGNATAGQILKGRTALVGGKQVTGTYEAPTCPNLATQTPGDAMAENIDEGKIAWVNGEKVVGKRKVQTMSDILRLGDYIRYTPSKSSYTISSVDTGYSSNQTINPSELNSWRVIQKNADGTVAILASTVSTTPIGFTDSDGTILEKYVKTLNAIASAYETEGITVSSRHVKSGDLSSAFKISATYWLAEYDISSGEIEGVRWVHLGAVQPSANLSGSKKSVRPIVVLRSDLKITGGDGTGSNPWTIAP